MSEKIPVTVAFGDGIGPEIMKACLHILDKADAGLEYDVIEIGEKIFLQGFTAGIKPEAWSSLRKTKVFFKAPISTPQGGGYKSLNVTARKTLGLYANVRPCRSFHPYVGTKHPVMDLIIIRENEEDLYSGIEYQQTQDVVQCLKIISRPGSEKIVRYAFEYAKAYGRKKVTCFSKDNIMKLTDGMFHKIFDEIGKEYPEIEKEHYIIDIGTALLADKPEIFDVIVTLNLYGDIISDVAAQIAGSVGMSGSSNIGDQFAMFEAIHGSAPTIAGKNIANPSGLLNAALMMLIHLNKPKIAENIHNAWLKTLEDGIHTADVYKEGISKQKVGTIEFADAVVARLGQKPVQFKPVIYDLSDRKQITSRKVQHQMTVKKLVGLDVFLDLKTGDANALGQKLSQIQNKNLELKMITNGGVKVYPDGMPETFLSDQWRCRFMGNGSGVEKKNIIELLNEIDRSGFDFVKTEHLYEFDNIKGYSLGQGE